MKLTSIIGIVFACIGVSYAATTATLSNPTPRVGDNVVLKCKTSPAGGRYATFYHTKKFWESDTPMVLARLQNLRKDLAPLIGNRYDITPKYTRGPPDAEEYNLEIKNIQYQDSGFLGCRYKDGDDIQETFAKLVVQVDSELVAFAEYPNKTDLIFETFRDQNIKVTCVVVGNIPSSHKMFLGEEDVTPTPTVIDTGFLQEGSTGKTRSTWISILVFDRPFTVDMRLRPLSCQSKTSGFPLKKYTVYLM